MAIVKVVEAYDGGLPIYNVVKEINDCDNCGCQPDKILKSFDTYEQAYQYCDNINRCKDSDGITSCGEEDPCQNN